MYKNEQIIRESLNIFKGLLQAIAKCIDPIFLPVNIQPVITPRLSCSVTATFPAQRPGQTDTEIPTRQVN